MKILVSGPRDWTDYTLIDEQLCIFKEDLTHIVHGGAFGADNLAGRWAQHHGIVEIIYAADWETYGKLAGPIRNQQMLDKENPDMVIAFQYFNKDTPGTQDMIDTARKASVPTMVVYGDIR